MAGKRENSVGTVCAHDPVALTRGEELLNAKAGALGSVNPSAIPILNLIKHQQQIYQAKETYSTHIPNVTKTHTFLVQ